MFIYGQVYWLESPWEADSMVLTGAALDPEWGWTFWRGDESDGITTRSLALTALTAGVNGTIEGEFKGFTFSFRPVSAEQVRAAPLKFGLTPEEAENVKTDSDIYLRLHAMRVPEWYEQRYEYAGAAEEAAAIEASYQLLNEGREAPEGAIHYWPSKGKFFRKTNGIWRELTEGEKWVDRHPALPEDTYDLYRIPGTDRFIETRERKHDAILNRLFEGKKPSKQPQATLTMGLPASGKSVLAREFLNRRNNEENVVVLDPDSHREHLDEYQAAVALKSRNGSSIVQKEVTAINDKGLERVLADIPDRPGEHYNLLLDGVGSDIRWYKKLIARLRDKGYRIQLLYPHVGDTPEISGIDALKIRTENRGIETGRFARQDQIDLLYSVLPTNFNELAELVDDATVFDTADAEAPKEVYRRTNTEVFGDPAWFSKLTSENSESGVTPTLEGTVAKAPSFDAIRAMYLQALKTDLKGVDVRPTGEKAQYAPGEGVIEVLADPVSPAAESAPVKEAASGAVKIVDGVFYVKAEDGSWKKLDGLP